MSINESAPLTELTTAQVLIGGDSDELTKSPLTSGTYYTKVRLMRKHPTVKLARALAVAPLLAAQWSVAANDGAPEGAKEFITDEVLPNRLHLLRTSLFGCVDFGWQAYEKVYVMRELGQWAGKIGISKIKPLLQDKTKILVDPVNGSFAGLLNETNITVRLGIPESLAVSFDAEGTNWYGVPDMEAVIIPFDNWEITNKANVQYDRKIAGAHWIIWYPPGKGELNGVKTDNFEIARQLLITLETSGSFVVPKSIQGFVDDLNSDKKAWEIELKAAYPTSQVAFIDRMNYLDKLIVRAFGLPERAVLEGVHGTKAEAEAHGDFAINNMELRHLLMVQQYNWHLVNQILRLNFGPEFENTVWIEVSPIADLSLKYLRDLYKQFLSDPTGMAMESDRIDFEAMRSRLNIPELSLDEIGAVDDKDAGAAMQNFAKGLIPSTN